MSDFGLWGCKTSTVLFSFALGCKIRCELVESNDWKVYKKISFINNIEARFHCRTILWREVIKCWDDW